MTAFADAPSFSRQHLASSNPRDLLLRPDFWLRQRALFVASGGFMIVLITLAKETYAHAGGWEWLSVFVQLLAVWGGYIAASALASLEVEQAIVGDIERRGSEFLRDLKSGQRSRIELDHLENSMVPANPSDPSPAMIRLFQHIIKEARDRRFESSVQVMQPYREEPLEDVFKLQNLQKIALWLGILGTFVGLLHAIAEATVDGGDFSKVVERMFDGLKISFSASLAGLEVAVFLGALLLILRKAQERYFKQMEGAVVTMLSLARNAVNKDEYLAEFAQIRETVNTLTDTVYDHAQEIKAQTEQIGVGMTRLVEAKSNFDSFLNRISETQDNFIGDIRSIYDTISLKNLTETLEGTLKQATMLMGMRMEVSSQQISNRLADFNQTVEKLATSLHAQARESSDTARTLAAQIATANNENITATKSVVTRIQELQSKDTTTVAVIRKDLQDLAQRVAALTSAVERTGHFTVGPRSFRSFVAWLFG